MLSELLLMSLLLQFLNGMTMTIGIVLGLFIGLVVLAVGLGVTAAVIVTIKKIKSKIFPR